MGAAEAIAIGLAQRAVPAAGLDSAVGELVAALLAIPAGAATETLALLAGVAAGRDPDEALLAWMREFTAKSGAPFFYEQKGERYGFGPIQFQQEMQAKLDAGERLW